MQTNRFFDYNRKTLQDGISMLWALAKSRRKAPRFSHGEVQCFGIALTCKRLKVFSMACRVWNTIGWLRI